MRIPGRRHAHLVAEWLRSRAHARVLILGYHRVADVAADPYNLCVSRGHFAQQMRVLKQMADVLSLEELLDGLRRSKLPAARGVVVTFDDGYADMYAHVLPILEQHSVPATFFVTPAYQGREFWWDKLARAVSGLERPHRSLSLMIGERKVTWRAGADAGNGLLLWLYGQLLPLAEAERRQVMTQLWDQVGCVPAQDPLCRGMSEDEVVQMAASSLVEIGAHSLTHPSLAALPVSAQREEILASKTCLEQMIGRPVRSFSYPNGSYSDETKAVLAEAGFHSACTSRAGVVLARHSDLYALPRFWIPDWDGQTFSHWLQKWL